jgi:DNA-binding HxlR family transcriptional regulator
VAGAAPQPTREQELKAAFRKARMSQRAHRVLSVLLYDLARWHTGIIPPERQPRTRAALAKKCDMSEATLNRALSELEDLGWVVRIPHPGRGLTTGIQVEIGRSAPPKTSRPMTAAERARRYRERKKAAQQNVTPVAESGSDSRDASRKNDVTRHVTGRDDFAGQDGRAAVRPSVTRGEVGEVAGESLPSPAEPLTLTIAGVQWPAVLCLGCGCPVAEVVSFDGCHAMCEAS